MNDNVPRLTGSEVGQLIAEGKLPLINNPCIREFEPLGSVNGNIQCLREELTEFCEFCPMMKTRIFKPALELVEDQLTVKEKVMRVKTVEIPFKARVVETKRGQFLVNIPAYVVKNQDFNIKQLTGEICLVRITAQIIQHEEPGKENEGKVAA